MPIDTMPVIISSTEQLKPGDHFISVTRGMRGYFAVEMWMNNEDAELGVFAEPWSSDDLSFGNEEQAKRRAHDLANEMALPLMV